MTVGRWPRGRPSAGAAVVVSLLSLSACSSSPDDPETVRREVSAACTAAREERADLDAVDAEEFSRVGVDFASSFRDPVGVMLDANADDDLSAQLEDLANTMGEVASGLSALRTAIELRDFEDFPADLVTAREALPALDEAASDLGLDECRPEELVSDWIDAAEGRADAAIEAAAPTGDYPTDLERACGRFAEDSAGIGLAGNAIDAMLAISGLQQALEILHRDVGALEPAADDRDAHAELLDLIDQAIGITRDAARTGLTPDERQALVDDFYEVTDGITEATTELGARC